MSVPLREIRGSDCASFASLRLNNYERSSPLRCYSIVSKPGSFCHRRLEIVVTTEKRGQYRIEGSSLDELKAINYERLQSTR